MSGEDGVAAGPRQGAAAVERGDAANGHDEHADRGEPGDGAALDGEVIPPEKIQAKRTLPSDAQQEELLAGITAAHAALEASVRTTVEMAVKLGQALVGAKRRFSHGDWLPWLEKHTPINRRTAARYMQLAEYAKVCDRRDWSSMSNLGVAGALKEIGRHERSAREPTRQAKIGESVHQRDPDPAVEPAAPPAKTQKKVAAEAERQPEPVPARDSGPAVKPAVAASAAGASIEPAQTPGTRDKSGLGLLGEITSLQKKRDEGAVERSRELASLDRHSPRACELLDATIAAQERFLQGLRDLRERVRLETAEARP